MREDPIPFLCSPLSSEDVWGKPGMCLFVRRPFILEPCDEKTQRNQDQVFILIVTSESARHVRIVLRRGSSKQGGIIRRMDGRTSSHPLHDPVITV